MDQNRRLENETGLCVKSAISDKSVPDGPQGSLLTVVCTSTCGSSTKKQCNHMRRFNLRFPICALANCADLQTRHCYMPTMHLHHMYKELYMHLWECAVYRLLPQYFGYPGIPDVRQDIV
uniref:Uncharacterized protein n=1 Tax=Romanomermis culicivorax TaxID=13658 RepID=A0A915L1L8_ROMCU